MKYLLKIKIALIMCVCLVWVLPASAQSANQVSGMPIDIEVIGFDIKKDSKEEKQLREIASTGGGSYLPASNAAELSKALQATVDESIRKTLPPARQNEALRFEAVGGTEWGKDKTGPQRKVDIYAPDYEQYDIGNGQKKNKKDIYAPDYEQWDTPEGQVETR